MLQDGRHLPQEVAVVEVDHQADDASVPELDEPGHDLPEEADGVAAVPLTDDGLSQQPPHRVGHFSRVEEDGDVARKLDQAKSPSEDGQEVQDGVLAST